MDIISYKGMESNKGWYARKTAEVFRFGNRDSSHIKIVVSLPFTANRGVHKILISSDEGTSSRSGSYHLIKAGKNPKHTNKTKNLQ